MKKGLSLSLMLGFLATCVTIGTVAAAVRDLPDNINQLAAADHRNSLSDASTTQPLKTTDTLFVSQRGEDLWFVAEKVSKENYDFWHFFARKQEDTLLMENSPFFNLKRNAGDPLSKFMRCLKFFDKSDVWVIYATNVEPGKAGDAAGLLKHVEMSFACLTQKNVPFQLHMGIARNFLFLLEEGNKAHERISATLHAFAADAMHQIEPKTYIISTPLPAMTKIFKKTLKAGTYFEGVSSPDNLEESELPILSKGCVYDKDFSFVLRRADKVTIFSVAQEEAGSQYWWFFSNVQPSKQHPYFVIDIEKFLENSPKRHTQE